MADNSRRQIFYILMSEKGRAMLDLDYIPGSSTFPFTDEQKFYGINVDLLRENVANIRWHDKSIDICFFDEKNNKHWFSFDIECLRSMSAPEIKIIFEQPIKDLSKKEIPIAFSGNVVSMNVFRMKKEQRK